MKKVNLFMSSTLMCGFLCLAFTFDDLGLHWLWTGKTPIAISLVIATFVLAAFWIKSAKKLKLENQK